MELREYLHLWRKREDFLELFQFYEQEQRAWEALSLSSLSEEDFTQIHKEIEWWAEKLRKGKLTLEELFLFRDFLQRMRGILSCKKEFPTWELVEEEWLLLDSSLKEATELRCKSWHTWVEQFRKQKEFSPSQLGQALALVVEKIQEGKVLYHLLPSFGEEIGRDLEWLEKKKSEIYERLSHFSPEEGEAFLAEFHRQVFSLFSRSRDRAVYFHLFRKEMEEIHHRLSLDQYNPLMKRKHKKLFSVVTQGGTDEEWSKAPYHRYLMFSIFALMCLLLLQGISGLALFRSGSLWFAGLEVSFSLLVMFFFFHTLRSTTLSWRAFSSHFWTVFLPALPFGELSLFYTNPWVTFFLLWGRVVLLLLGLLDLTVARFAPVLSWNIVLFEPWQEQNLLKQSIDELDRAVFFRLQEKLENLKEEEKKDFTRYRVSLLSLWLKKRSGGWERKRVFEMPLEHLVHRLLRITPAELKELVSPSLAEKWSRRFQWWYKKVRGRDFSLFSLLAHGARTLGKFLEWLLDWIYKVADLHGLVTASQVLDKMGRWLVYATKRPAWKLLLLGSALLFLHLAVKWLGLSLLSPITHVVSRYLGLPIVVLGFSCLLLMLLGLWLVRLAGEASEFYEKVGEAQYINLLEEVKYKHCLKDIFLLYERVLRGERKTDEPPPSFERLLHSLEATCNLHTQDYEISQAPWVEGHIVSLLYRDYLDGAILHRTDVKTAEQLLGNLVLSNLRERLHYSFWDKRRLKWLDISKSASLLGPYFWFSSIVQSILQNTAKLVLEYNRMCIPKDVWHLAKEEERKKMEEWLERKQRGENTSFWTNEFTALHFLTADPYRDKYVELRFGKKVKQRLVEDRASLIRKVFGSFPFHHFPKAYRTWNFYYLYQLYGRNGRLLLLPVYLTILFVRGAKWLFSWLGKNLKEILSPHLIPHEGSDKSSWTNFYTALRKIHRMRKPIFMEVFRMRAKVDPEYVGIPIPGYALPFQDDLWEDLEFMQVSTLEMEEFLALRRFCEERMKEFHKFLVEEDLNTVEGAKKRLPMPSHLVAKEHYRILRALAVAYLLDEKGIATWDMARRQVIEFCESLSKKEKRVSFSPYFLWLRLRGKWEKTRKALECLSHFQGRSALEIDFYHRACLTHRKMRSCLLVLSEKKEKEWEKDWQEVARHFWLYTQELLTLRTIHTLSLLDIFNYRELVYKLGLYEQDSPPFSLFEPKDLQRFYKEQQNALGADKNSSR